MNAGQAINQGMSGGYAKHNANQFIGSFEGKDGH
jgi:hypothetical protein